VFEVDEDTTASREGHIRGAVGWNWTTGPAHDRSVATTWIRRASAECCLGGRGGIGDDGGPLWRATTTGSRRTPTGSEAPGFDDVKLLNGRPKEWELESRSWSQEVAELRAGSDQLMLRGDGSGPQIRALRDEVISRSVRRRIRRRPLTRGVSAARSRRGPSPQRQAQVPAAQSPERRTSRG
jgi:thiosulfate/3-mercaptopyruvate sulfurtransferase